MRVRALPQIIIQVNMIKGLFYCTALYTYYTKSFVFDFTWFDDDDDDNGKDLFAHWK